MGKEEGSRKKKKKSGGKSKTERVEESGANSPQRTEAEKNGLNAEEPSRETPLLWQRGERNRS